MKQHKTKGLSLEGNISQGKEGNPMLLHYIVKDVFRMYFFKELKEH